MVCRHVIAGVPLKKGMMIDLEFLIEVLWKVGGREKVLAGLGAMSYGGGFNCMEKMQAYWICCPVSDGFGKTVVGFCSASDRKDISDRLLEY